MKFLALSLFALLCSFANAQSSEEDVLIIIERNPRSESVQQPDGSLRPSKYGDYQIEEAVAKFSSLPRPWTVSKLIDWFKATDNREDRILFIRLIAATRSETGADFLSDLFSQNQYTIPSGYALKDYYLPFGVAGGTEQHLLAVQEWIEGRKAK